MSKGGAGGFPVTQTTYISDIPQWKKQLLGLTKDAPENSPYKWLSRQAVAKANMLEGMTFNPNMKSMSQYYGVPEGTDLSPYIYASRTGQVTPLPPMPTSAKGTTSAVPMPTAKAGGLMSLRKRGFAPGGSTKTKVLTPAQVNTVTRYNIAIAKGETPPQTLIDQINNIESKTGRNVSPYTDSGTAAVGNQALQSSINKAAQSGKYPQSQGTSPISSIATAYPKSNVAKDYGKYQTTTNTADNKATSPGIPLSQATEIKTPYYNPYDEGAKPYGGVTDPLFQQGVDYLKGISALPSQIGQATDIYGQASSGLAGLAGYSPQQVAAQNAAAQQAQATLANRGDIRDVTAHKADVDKYTAAQMKAPEGVQAMGYEAAQMQGPGSWTDEGVSQKYMSPYMQNVINIQKREKAKDYAQQQNELNKQAMAAGAFGGGRQAMQRSQASKDYQQQLQDLEAMGMQQAYQQGMQQYGQESQLTQQARQANQAAINAQKQQFVQNALQAALNNYGGQLTAEQQNMIAQNAASQFNSQALNTANLTYEQQQIAAQQMNQGADLQTALQNAQLATGVSQSNASLGTQAALANASNALQASMANQSAGLQANQQGIAAYGAMGNMAQGLGNLGLGAWQGQQNIAGLYGAAGNTSINAGKDWATNQYITGKGAWDANPYANVNQIVNQQPATTGSGTQTGIPR